MHSFYTLTLTLNEVKLMDIQFVTDYLNDAAFVAESGIRTLNKAAQARSADSPGGTTYTAGECLDIGLGVGADLAAFKGTPLEMTDEEWLVLGRKNGILKPVV